MSQENVEKVRAYLATWDGEMLRPESRPFQRITAMEVTVALYAPDYVYEDAVLPDHVGESYRGLDGSLVWQIAAISDGAMAELNID